MKTEIFGTFGPACKTTEILEEMIDAGLTGMRLNLSHTTLKESREYIETYQMVAREKDVKPQILMDMQGPELRIKELKRALELVEGTQMALTEDLIPVEVIDATEAGDEILFDDGKLLVQVVEKTEHLLVKVLRGGILQGAKSIKIKDKYVSMPPLTQHDIENIKDAKAYGVTALMQPFVLSAEELKKVRSILAENGAEDVQIFAKIENRLGMENLEDILQEADVIVIARGDLGNDMPLWELPGAQKQIEAACHKAGKPYVVVTQMLSSMEKHPVPTRAEVSDIYHAVYHGAWGVMLTGETAVGKYPVEAICYLANTAKEAEKKINFMGK